MKENEGIYCGLYFTKETNEALDYLFNSFIILEKGERTRIFDYHVTLIYDDTKRVFTGKPFGFPNIKNEEFLMYEPKIEQFGENYDVLVLSFNNPHLEFLHELAKRSPFNLKHSWDLFSPHITIAYGTEDYSLNISRNEFIRRIKEIPLVIHTESWEPIKE